METVGSNAQKVTEKKPVSRQTASEASSASFSSLLTGETHMSSEAPMRDDINVSLRETPSSADPSLHRIVIVGGGAAGLALATRLGRKLGRRGKISITLLDKSRLHIWKPLLHEIASGSLDSETDSLELIAHARWNHYRYRIGAMQGLNRAKRQIHVAPSFDDEGRQVIPQRIIGYDTLVIAVGSICNDFGTPGVAEYAIKLDTLDEAARFNQRLINACLRANAQYEPLQPGQLHCAIIGAGATGVELAAEIHKTMRDIGSYNLDSIDIDKLVQIDLIEAAPRLLPALPEHLAKSTEELLRKLGVIIHTNTRVIAIGDGKVELQSGETIQAELIVWSAGIKAPDFLGGLDGLESDRSNRLVVRPTMQTTRDDDVFAIGDCACCVLPGSKTSLPPRAQTAHQQASYMVNVIEARFKKKPLPVFTYRDFGSLVSLSDYRTFGNILGGLKIEGMFAQLMYRSLHKMHLRTLHGTTKVALKTLGELIAKRTEPRIKLH
jgi:NADH:ubiquinone reductase (H+-translocating)